MTNTKEESVREEAKKLGIGSWHLKSIDKLEAEIAEAKGTTEKAKAEPVRKKAPRIQVSKARGSSRQKKLDELNKAHPEYIHQYRPFGTEQAKIEAGGFEVVPGETRGEEIIVRTMRDSYDEYLAESNNAEAEKMEAGVDDSGRMVQRQTASPKSPVKD